MIYIFKLFYRKILVILFSNCFFFFTYDTIRTTHPNDLYRNCMSHNHFVIVSLPLAPNSTRPRDPRISKSKQIISGINNSKRTWKVAVHGPTAFVQLNCIFFCSVKHIRKTYDTTYWYYHHRITQQKQRTPHSIQVKTTRKIR